MATRAMALIAAANLHWGLGPGMDAALVEPASGRAREALLSESGSMLAVHVPGMDGWCVGCADLGRFALAPCPVARQALLRVETHGVAGWDARPAASAGEGHGGVSSPPIDACGASHSRVAV